MNRIAHPRRRRNEFKGNSLLRNHAEIYRLRPRVGHRQIVFPAETLLKKSIASCKQNCLSEANLIIELPPFSAYAQRNPEYMTLHWQESVYFKRDLCFSHYRYHAWKLILLRSFSNSLTLPDKKKTVLSVGLHI